MPDTFSSLFTEPVPTAERPLAGVTVLVVEDSRFASEAVRLLCLRSGARIRRADSLRTAERHLATYRPTVVLVDLGLPDGSGVDLIERLATANPRLPAIFAISGDEGGREKALQAGADAFLAKPIVSLAEFQSAILSALNIDAGLRTVPNEFVTPDPLAYRDDLALISDCLDDDAKPGDVAYAAQFLAGVARSAEDTLLADAAVSLTDQMTAGGPTASQVAHIAGMVKTRLKEGKAEDTRRLA